jgi:hypothetical protein
MLAVGLLPAQAAQAEDAAALEQEYVRSIIGVLGIHAQSIRRLSAQEIAYSSNVVRHAVALQRTFGLLGPMEWHVARSISLSRQRDPASPLDEKTFHALTERNRAALEFLDVAAHRWMRDKNRELLIGALDDLVRTCNDCHARLPQGSVPDVTGPLMAD